MPASQILARDRGLDLVARINRWMIAGAVGVTGVVSVAAANAFKGHSSLTHASAASAPAPVQQSAPSDDGGGEGGGLQQPAQAPAASQPAPSAPVVSSGGS